MNSIKQMIRTGAATLCAVCLLSACSSTLDEAIDGGNTAQALTNIQIGDFPAFGSEANNGTQTRSAAIGTYDAGKTEWENGDEILLKITDSKSEVTTATLVYDGTKWAPKEGTLTLLYEGETTVNAYYAPAYEWKNNELALKTDKSAGTEEYLTYTATQDLTKGLAITFDSRNYSRLRVATVPGVTLRITSGAFTANDGATLATNGLTATADDKGNAYFYGSWAADASLNVYAVDNDKAYTMAAKALSKESEATKSYAMDMIPTGCKQWGAGTEEAPYLIANAAQLANIATVNNNNDGGLTDYFTQIADIDLSSVCSESSKTSWTPIGGLGALGIPCYFKGTYDGGNHSISNIYCISDITSVGLFGEIYEATIKNVRLTSGSVSGGSSSSGGIVGSCVGNILNCSNAATINGTRYCGGIAGLVPNNDISVIAGCSNSGSVKSSGDNTRIGGIVGNFAKPTSIIVGCSNTGNISSTNASTSSGGVGGIAGYIWKNNIQGCFTTGIVSKFADNTTIGTVVGTCDDSESSTYKGSVSNVYYVANEGIEPIGYNINNMSCTDVTVKTLAEMNETATVNSLNASIKAWNNANTDDKQCNYHFEAGTGTATPLPVIVEGAPQ